MLYVVVFSVVVDASDVVYVVVCLMKLCDDCCIVPLLVWGLNKCIIVVGVSVLVVVLVKLMRNRAAGIDTSTSSCGDVCDGGDVVGRAEVL